MYVISHKVLSVADPIHKWSENWRLSADSAPWNCGNDCWSLNNVSLRDTDPQPSWKPACNYSYVLIFSSPLYTWLLHIPGSSSADSTNLRLCSIAVFIHVYVIGPTRLPRLRPLVFKGWLYFFEGLGSAYLSIHHSLQLGPFTPKTPSSCFTHLLVLYHSHWLCFFIFTDSGCRTFHGTFHSMIPSSFDDWYTDTLSSSHTEFLLLSESESSLIMICSVLSAILPLCC